MVTRKKAEAPVIPPNMVVFPSHEAFEDSIALAVEARLEERLAELEFAQEDVGWVPIGGSEAPTDFSRAFLRTMTARARNFYLKNPLINRGVSIQAMYVFGQGMSITARDRRVQQVIDDFLEDPDNQTELTSHQARMGKEVDLQVEGNIFFALFTADDGTVKVRSLPFDEVDDVITDPDDAKKPQYYKRCWSQRTFNVTTGRYNTQQQIAYYPDYRYDPPDHVATIGKAPVLWDAPVMQVKVGGLAGMKFGVSETYAAHDWALAHKAFLEDWATIVRAYRRFAFQYTVDGDKRAVAAAKAKLNTTLASNGVSAETNPPPLTGSVLVQQPGRELQPVRTSGATVAAQDGRELRLQVCAALGLPETFFGDADVGNYATAKTLDRPTELKFRDRQTLWGDVHEDILQYVVDQQLKAHHGKLPDPDPGDQNPDAAVAADAAIVAVRSVDQLHGDLDRTIDVRFPPILHHDMKEWVAAIVQGMTMDGKQPVTPEMLKLGVRMILTALGEENVDSQLQAIFPTKPGDPSPGITLKPKTPPPPPAGQQPPPAAPAPPVAKPAAKPAPTKKEGS